MAKANLLADNERLRKFPAPCVSQRKILERDRLKQSLDRDVLRLLQKSSAFLSGKNQHSESVVERMRVNVRVLNNPKDKNRHPTSQVIEDRFFPSTPREV